MMFSPTIPDHLCRKRPANMKTQTLSIDLLRIDANTQSRLAINQEVVEEYAELIAEAGTEWPFPPLDVFHDGTDYYVADGFHRKLGGVQAKRGSIPCNIHEGTAKDARIFGMTANDRHGLRMTRADKRSCVEWLLDNPPKRTQAEIAELAGVSKRTVQVIVADRNAKALKIPSKVVNKAQTAPETPNNKQSTPPPAPPAEPIDDQDEPDDLDDEDREPTDDEIRAAASAPPKAAAAKPEGKPVKALEGREAQAFDARRSISGMHKTIAQWFVPVDKIRDGFPGPVGDKVLEHMKAAYEALKKWEKVIK